MIADVLGTGIQNAKTTQQLSFILGRTSRDITRGVQAERRRGVPICSSTTRPRGYYLASTAEDMRRFCRKLSQRAREIDKTRRACELTIKKLPETNDISLYMAQIGEG